MIATPAGNHFFITSPSHAADVSSKLPEAGEQFTNISGMASWRAMFPKVSKGKRPKTAGPFEKTGVLTVLSADAKWNGYDIWMIYIYIWWKTTIFFISFVDPSIALKVSTKVLALPPKESLSNCLKWLGDLGDGSGFATWKWNNMENYLRPPGKMHVEMEHGSNGSVALGLALISLRGTKESLTEVVPCSNFTILYHNVSWTWVLPYAAIPNVPEKSYINTTNFNKSHGRHRISEWWTSGDDFGMAHAFALWSRPCCGVSTGLKFWVYCRSVHQSLTHYWSPWSPMVTLRNCSTRVYDSKWILLDLHRGIEASLQCW